MKKIAIVGSGIAGLATAYSLEEKSKKMGVNVRIDLIEKNDRIGGNILTERSDKFVIEGGPDCVFSEKPAALALCEKLGLGDTLLKTNESKKGASVYWNGRLHDLPEGVMLMVPTMVKPMLFSTLLTFSGKIRIGMEFFVPKKVDKTEETLGQFVIRRFGRELLDKIAEPLVAGIHAGNPDTMSILASFPRFVELEQGYGSLIKGMLAKKRQMGTLKKSKESKYTMFMTLKNGLDELPKKIQNSLTLTNIKLNTEVSKLEKKEAGYLCKTKEGDLGPYDSIVIATPAYAAAGITKSISRELDDLLMQIPYVSTATVSLAFPKSSLTSFPEGFGFIVPKISKRKIMAATYTSIKFSHRSDEENLLIRVFVGGASNESLVFQNDLDMITMVKKELKEIAGIFGEPIFLKIFRWDKAMPQYIVGHLNRVNAIENIASQLPGLYFTGSAYKGIGISDCIKSGENTAEQAIAFLAGL
jgi:oxygen-dependent protoporphyrinogen oxidase